MNRVMSWLARTILSLALLLGLGAGPALAYDNPDLLPDHPTPVIDLAKILTDNQRAALEAELDDFEAVSGWKLRVLTQYDRTPGLAVKDFWGLDERSLLLIADERGGNLLNFNVGDALFALMPRTYWVELQTRFGNVYYVRDHGQDASILDSLHTVKGCLEIGGCQVVPGLPQEQWLLTLATSILGGLIVGFAAYPRKPEHTVEWASFPTLAGSSYYGQPVQRYGVLKAFYERNLAELRATAGMSEPVAREPACLPADSLRCRLERLDRVGPRSVAQGT